VLHCRKSRIFVYQPRLKIPLDSIAGFLLSAPPRYHFMK
jgi:hypothetical protein